MTTSVSPNRACNTCTSHGRFSPCLSDIALFLMLALLPPLHLTGFTRADDLRNPVFALLSFLCAVGLLGGVLRKGRSVLTRSFLIPPILFLLLAVAQLLREGSWQWSLFQMAPLIGGGIILLSGAFGGEDRLKFKGFALGTSIGLIATSLFTLLDFFQVPYATIIWTPSPASGAFDAAEFGIVYTAMAVVACMGATVTLCSPWRLLSGAAALLGAFSFGLMASGPASGPFVSPVIFLIGAALILPGIAAWLLSRHTNYRHTISDETSDTPDSAEGALLLHPRQLALRSFGAAILLSAIAFGGSSLQLAGNAPTGKSGEAGKAEATAAIEAPIDFGDPEWASAPPVIDPNQRPMREGRLLNTLFASGRWESVHSPKTREDLRQTALLFFQERSLEGSGPGSWYNLQSREIADNSTLFSNFFNHYPVFKTLHNSYLQSLVEYGIVGTVIIVLLFAFPFLYSLFRIRTLTREPGVELFQATTLIAAALVAWVGAFTTPVFELVTPAMQFAATLSILSLLVQEARRSNLHTTQKDLETPPLPHPQRPFLSLGIAIVVSGIAVVAAVSTLRSNIASSRADQWMLYEAYDRAEPDYVLADSLAPGRADTLYNAALASYREEASGTQLDEILSRINRALAIRPFDARYHAAKSEVLFKKGSHGATEAAMDTDSIISAANETLRLFPNYVEVVLDVASYHQSKGENEKAEELLKKALSRHPPTHYAAKLNNALGVLYLDFINNPALATKHLKLALEQVNATTLASIVPIQKDLKRASVMTEIEHRKREHKPIPKELLKELDPHAGHNHGGIPGLPTPPGEDAHDHHEHDGHEHDEHHHDHHEEHH